MQEWNVVLTVRDFKRSCDVLGSFGRVKRTDFYNTLLMRAEDVDSMLEALREKSLEDSTFLTCISKIIPVSNIYTFQSPEEFKRKAKEIVLTWIDKLGGKRFYVRMHRRGFKGKLSSLEEEQFLDTILLKALQEADTPGNITFQNPDAIIVVETIANWAGLSLLTKEQLQRYPFIRVI